MIDNKYSSYLLMLKVYHDFLKGLETSTAKDSSTRYMMQRNLLDKVKEASTACDISEGDFADKQQFIAFKEEQKFIDEEINKTNEILEKEFCLRID